MSDSKILFTTKTRRDTKFGRLGFKTFVLFVPSW